MLRAAMRTKEEAARLVAKFMAQRGDTSEAANQGAAAAPVLGFSEDKIAKIRASHSSIRQRMDAQQQAEHNPTGETPALPKKPKAPKDKLTAKMGIVPPPGMSEKEARKLLLEPGGFTRPRDAAEPGEETLIQANASAPEPVVAKFVETPEPGTPSGGPRLEIHIHLHKSKAKEPFANGFSTEEAKRAAKALGIDFHKEGFTLRAFTDGMNVEREHADVSHTAETIGKIAHAHLKERTDYYERLKEMEAEPVKKAGPYIGKRGGKWADPQHTIAWKDKNKTSTRGKDNETEDMHQARKEVRSINRKLIRTGVKLAQNMLASGDKPKAIAKHLQDKGFTPKQADKIVAHAQANPAKAKGTKPKPNAKPNAKPTKLPAKERAKNAVAEVKNILASGGDTHDIAAAMRKHGIPERSVGKVMEVARKQANKAGKPSKQAKPTKPAPGKPKGNTRGGKTAGSSSDKALAKKPATNTVEGTKPKPKKAGKTAGIEGAKDKDNTISTDKAADKPMAQGQAEPRNDGGNGQNGQQQGAQPRPSPKKSAPRSLAAQAQQADNPDHPALQISPTDKPAHIAIKAARIKQLHDEAKASGDDEARKAAAKAFNAASEAYDAKTFKPGRSGGPKKVRNFLDLIKLILGKLFTKAPGQDKGLGELSEKSLSARKPRVLSVAEFRKAYGVPGTVGNLAQFNERQAGHNDRRTPALPDFEAIYTQPESTSEMHEREREADIARQRDASRKLNGTFGFHGVNEAEPMVRYKTTDGYAKDTTYGPKLGMEKPVQTSEKLRDKVSANQYRKPNEKVSEEDKKKLVAKIMRMRRGKR